MKEASKFITQLVDSFKVNHAKVAIIDQDGKRITTYDELFTLASQVAGYLQQKNYPPHSFIGICLPSSMEYVAAEIGIWLAGHAIVPMGDKYPKDRIDYIMHHCESPLLINDEVIQAMMKTEPAENYVLPDEEDTNALFYTSGSTGVPKAVMANFASYRISPTDESIIVEENITVMGITAPMFFVVSKQLYAIIVKGGIANFIPTEIIKDIRLFEDYLAKHQIEFVFMPPSLLAHFHNKSAHLKVVMAAAERLSGISSSNYKIYNHYGLTETGGTFFSFFVDKEYENTPIGKPDADVEYCILDTEGKPVKPGEEGELCVRGPFTTGYYKEPELTEDLFRGGWLHTGDIVSQLPDGNVLYVNRKDWMVKINGQRVEPGEVEAVIKQVNGMDNAVVKGFTTKDRQYLCAYYIANDDVSEDTIRDYLLSKLPAYMVPAYFVRMEHFPLLPSGKINRKALPAPTTKTEGIIRPPYAAPTNDNEHQLCEAFEKALSVERVGIDDDFFELGGDSIRVMEVQTLCPELALSSQMIYANRTPKRIAEACAHTDRISFARQNDYPLSQTQLGIYIECMSRHGEVAYNNGMLFQLKPTIDIERLSKACEAIVEAHPFIKTRLFIDNQGEPRLLRNDNESYHQSIESLPQQEFDKLQSELIRPFDLLKDRLFRIRILKTSETQYLFIDFHHIIFDGLSYNILLKDLKDAYEQLHIEREEFSGYEITLEEESLRKTDAYVSAKNWYKEQFEAIKVSSLPLPEKQEQIITYGQEFLDLAVDYNQLQEASNRLGVTPNVLTTTVFGYLLGVNTHAQESLFATIFSGRQDLKTQRTVAMLVKTLPVYTRWDGNTTIKAFLQTTKQQLLGSMSNSLFSFAEIKAMNNAINSHILFAYQGDLKPSDSDLFTYQPIMENATGENLAFEILRNDTKLVLHTEYHSNEYTQSYIQRLMHCYDTILQGFINSEYEDKSLWELPILNDKEQETILTLGTGDQLEYDRSETIVDLFHRQATLRSENIAVVDEISNITYGELDRKSDILAMALRKAGVDTDTFVAIMLPRRKEFLIAVFAVFKAGGAYVPIDSDYPKERLAYILRDSEANVLITTSTLLKDCQTEQYYPKEKQLCIDDFDFHELSGRHVNYAQPSGLAYMIYTSGSTGNPKGVMIQHKGLCALMKWLVPLEELKAGEKCAEHASFSFDASLFDLYPPLTCGAEVHILSSELRHDMESMCAYFKQHNIIGMTMSTQLGMEMINSHELPLRYMVMGGEKMNQLRKTSVKIINGYGPTEFTVCSSYHIVNQNKEYNSIPIGCPVPNSTSVIVDTEGRLVPQGTVGELCLIGSQMSRGYWKQEELTKEHFVDCTFLRGEKMYRTGDLVRWNEEGLLEYIGRIDNQVKLHGYRIELEEIGNKISHYPGVTSAVAVIHKQGNIEFIVAYYVSEGNKELQGIQETLAAALPSYMMPSRIIRIDQMPLTPNGKIDLKALTIPDMNHAEVVKPETSMEKQVFDIVADLLKTSQFGVTDNLVFYGLSSLSAMRLCVILEKHLFVRVRMADIMKVPTVRAIAAKIETSEHANSLHAYTPQAVYPLMENQRGLYFEWKKNRHTTQYNMPSVYRFQRTDADQLVHALKQTIDTHSYMKARLVKKDNDVVFERHDEKCFEIALTVTETEPSIDFFQKRVRPFKLLNEPLFRMEVISAPNHLYLFFDVHHIIFDGLSRNIFMNDLKRAYDGETLEQETYQAYDYSLYEQDELKNTEKMRKAEAWYDEILTDANEIVIPSFTTPDGIDCAHVEVTLPSREIESFCAANGVTVNSYMHAAFAIALKRLIKEDNLLYLTISNGRDTGAELQQCVGMFVKTLPIVISAKIVKGLSNVEYVKEIHKQLQMCYSMDCYPYTKIVERHQINGELMFIFQGGLNDNSLWDNAELIPLSLDTPKFPISITVTPTDNSYRINLEYDGKRYNHQVMMQMANAFKNILLELARTTTVDEVVFLNLEEKAKLLKLSKGEIIEYDQSETFVDLFNRQVAMTPDAVAVVDSKGHLTYRELDNQSNIIANILINRGIVENDFVGVMLPRVKEFLVAVLGVFKAGGAYIPLDHEYPDARLSYMLNDAQAKQLLTTRTLVSNKGLGINSDTEMIFMDDVDLNCESVPVNNSHSTSLAYMIYTSGSTGKPKGVMMQHKGLCALMKWLVPLEELKAGDKCAEHASFSFDASLFDLFPPLTCGAEVHILSSKLRLDMEGMCTYFNQHHIIGMTMSTQLGMEMINSHELPLRYMVMGGEKMNQLRKTSVKLINGYGPTEFTVCSSYHIVNQENKYDTIPIGRPVPNSMSVIVDSMGDLVPEGIPGELCLIGSQMAQGYWNRPELTEKHFTDCPFIAGEKMYHTGDLARWNNDGELEYLKRMDSQFKIRGYRVELGEIENKIVEFPGVTSAAVIVHQERKTQYIIGYFTSTTTIDPEKIQEYLRLQLPEYMIPQFTIQLSAMPMSPNGKINRKKLIGNRQMFELLNKEAIAPMTKNEKKLYDLAKQVLKIKDFGVSDDLTLLGLTSLSAIKLADLAHQKRLYIKVNDILRNKSIRNILTCEQSIGRWENAYDASKPVIVMIQGFTSYERLKPFINKLNERYNIFIFEPISDHFEFLFNEDKLSSHDVVEFYLDYLETNLPSHVNIEMFIGHSFGGELAYRSAERWHKKMNIMPKVCMLDTYAHIGNIAKKITIPKTEDLSPDEKANLEEFKEWDRHLKQILSLEDGNDLPSYDGDVLYFQAENMSLKLNTIVNKRELKKMKQGGMDDWSTYAPHISTYPVAATHFSMLDERFCDNYVEIIDNIVLPHNTQLI